MSSHKCSSLLNARILSQSLVLSNTGPAFCRPYSTRSLRLDKTSLSVLHKVNMSGDTHCLQIEAPKSLSVGLHVPQKVLCGAGPTNMPQRVQSALDQPLLGHLHKEFVKIMDDIQCGIKYVFQTTNEVTFALSGTGHAGLECCLVNLVEPGDSVCVVRSGIWGERCTEMVERLGAVPHVIESGKLGKGVSEEEVKFALEKFSPKLLYVAQGESSTGVMENIEMISRLCYDYKCLSLIDTVASLGAVEFKMDEWKVDCVFSGSQKVLASPPGTALISFGPKAVAKFKSRKTKVPSYLFDLEKNAMYWNIEEFGPRGYHYTGAISSFYALRESLAVVCDEGLVETRRRHQDAAIYLHDKLKQLNLELLVEDEKFRLPTITTVKVPSAVDPAAVCAFLMDNFMLEVAGGLGPTKGLAWRIGLMGPNATRQTVDFVIDCLKKALIASNVSHL